VFTIQNKFSLSKCKKTTELKKLKIFINPSLFYRLPRNNAETNTVKRVADQMTILRGARPMLKDFLIQSLIQSGWDDKVRLLCRSEITKHNGLISVDSLVDKVTPQARSAIEDELKAEMIAKIKAVLLKANS
jgi:Transcription factor e(y)2